MEYEKTYLDDKHVLLFKLSPDASEKATRLVSLGRALTAVWEMGFQWIRHSAVNLAGSLDTIPKDKTVSEKMVGR